MRRPLISIALLLAIQGILGCGGSKSTAPAPDPNAGLYGTWNGTLIETRQPGPTVNQFGITMVIAKGSIAFYAGGAQYPAAIVAMQDPTMSFQLTNGSAVITYSASRSGGTMNGGGAWPDGLTSDVFAVTKAAASTRTLVASAKPDPRFGSH
jgi:hypothetical protein